MSLPPRHSVPPSDTSSKPAKSKATETTKVYEKDQSHSAQDEDASASGTPVNAFSRAVLPSDQFRLHYDYMIRDMYRRKINPADWQVIAGDEVRLDEDGMDVEFTMLLRGTNQVWRRRINIQGGRLISIVER